MCVCVCLERERNLHAGTYTNMRTRIHTCRHTQSVITDVEETSLHNGNEKKCPRAVAAENTTARQLSCALQAIRRWAVYWDGMIRTLDSLLTRYDTEICLLKWYDCEPVWPSGKQTDLSSNPLRHSFLFKNCGLWTVLWLCPSQVMKH